MQKHNAFIQDIRGCLTRFDPLTQATVAAETKDGLTYLELKEAMSECGMDTKEGIL